MGNSPDLLLLIGGPQGGGIESAGQIALKTLILKGYSVIGTRDYKSNIMGAHSYYTIRARFDRPGAIRFPVDAAVALDAESILTHFGDVKPGGILVYDKGSLHTKIDAIQPMEQALKERLKKLFAEKGLPPVAESAIKLAEEKGVRLIPLPMRQLVRKLAEITGASLTSVARAVNTIGLTAMLYLMGIEPRCVEKAIATHFAAKKKVVAINVEAAKLAVDYVEENFGAPNEFLPDGPHRGKKVMLATGNEVVAMGKITGGLTFQSYYPITPASDEAIYMEKFRYHQLTSEAEAKLGTPKLGTVIVQTEDELSAIIMAIGAASAGARAATSTSGPGFALMNEAISLAIMAEVPIVITIWQRGGPSTGLPTKEGQQDLLHALFSGHGDNPKIVLASGDHVEAFYDAIKLLNWAEKYQTPAIHLLDKYLASTTTVLYRDEIDPGKAIIERGWRVENPTTEKRYMITDTGISPFIPIGGDTMIITGLEHTEEGFPTEDPVLRDEMVEKRRRKFETIAKEIPAEEKIVLHGDPDAKVTLVSWGSTKPIILESLKILEEKGVKANFLQIRLFYPFPAKEVLDVLSRAETVINIEQNDLLQAAFLIKGFTGYDIKHHIKKTNGRAFWDTEIANAVLEILETGKKEVVVKGGA